MIGYEKLKICHELMQEYNKFYCEYEFGWSDKVLFKLFNEENYMCIYSTSSLEDLIEKLTELTKSLTDDEPDIQTHQHQVDINRYPPKSSGENTRKARDVIDEYSTPVYQEGEHKKECQHEPEMDFGKDSRLRFEKSKNLICRKCGEFYQ